MKKEKKREWVLRRRISIKMKAFGLFSVSREQNEILVRSKETFSTFFWLNKNSQCLRNRGRCKYSTDIFGCFMSETKKYHTRRQLWR